MSYSRHDTAFVRQIVADLERAGHVVWVDQDDLEGGESWRRAITDAIRESDAVIVVLSPSSAASSDVERELVVATEHGRRLLPMLIRPCELRGSVQYTLAGIQWIDATTRPYETALSDLLADLASPPPAWPPPAPEERVAGPTVEGEDDALRCPHSLRLLAFVIDTILSAVLAGGVALAGRLSVQVRFVWVFAAVWVLSLVVYLGPCVWLSGGQTIGNAVSGLRGRRVQPWSRRPAENI